MKTSENIIIYEFGTEPTARSIFYFYAIYYYAMHLNDLDTSYKSHMRHDLIVLLLTFLPINVRKRFLKYCISVNQVMMSPAGYN